jgi:hypothetical protein
MVFVGEGILVGAKYRVGDEAGRPDIVSRHRFSKSCNKDGRERWERFLLDQKQ